MILENKGVLNQPEVEAPFVSILQTMHLGKAGKGLKG